MDNRDKYRALCKGEISVPVFSQPWWLDAVCGEEGWDVCLAEKSGTIVGALPFHRLRRMFFNVIMMPKLTQNFQLWIKYPDSAKRERRLSHEKWVITELIRQLPPFDYFQMSFYHTLTNWLPFYWKGFSQTTLYTYVVDTSRSEEEIWSDFKSNMRNKVRKASKLVAVTSDLGLAAFYDLSKKTFARQRMPMPFSFRLVQRMDEALRERHRRRIFFAVDDSGRRHSALYLIWDDQSSYVHMVGEDPNLRGSGAGILLIWEAIRYTKNQLGLSRFDFEGSMIESVEEVRRACGGRQVPMLSVKKTTPLMEVLMTLRRLKKRLMLKWYRIYALQAAAS